MPEAQQPVETLLVKRYSRRLNAGRTLDRAAWVAAISAFGLGLLILGIRLFAAAWAPMVPHLLKVYFGSMIAGVMVIWWTWSGRRQDVAAFADRHGRAGGLLMTMDEVHDPAWRALLKDKYFNTEPPRPRIDTPLLRLLVAAVFVGGALLVPQRFSGTSNHLLQLGLNHAERVEERVRRFEQENILEPESLDVLKKEIDKLKESIKRGEFGASEWEALDALHRRMDERIMAGASALQAAADVFSEDDIRSLASSLPQALEALKNAGLLQGESLSISSADLATLEGAAASLEGLSPEQLQHIAELLRQVSPGACEGLLSLCRDGNSELGRCLEGIKSTCLSGGRNPGRGSVSRGPGAAELNFEGDSPKASRALEPDRLSGAITNVQPGELLATEQAEPNEGPDQVADRSSARALVDGTQEEAIRAHVSPRHRGVVRRFFSPSESRPVR